jgi:glycine/D-amino acid oxidase-like deaminating enzyme
MGSAVDRRGATEPPDIERGEPRSVIVIGAGITGLVAAYELKRRGVPVTVYEAPRGRVEQSARRSPMDSSPSTAPTRSSPRRRSRS